MDPLRVIRIAFSVLTDRLFSILAMVMTFGLSCWAMYAPAYERMAMAAFFACVVYIPALRYERNSHVHHEAQGS